MDNLTREVEQLRSLDAFEHGVQPDLFSKALALAFCLIGGAVLVMILMLLWLTGGRME